MLEPFRKVLSTAAIGVRGLGVCRVPETLDRAMGPRYHGFDIDSRPVEYFAQGAV